MVISRSCGSDAGKRGKDGSSRFGFEGSARRLPARAGAAKRPRLKERPMREVARVDERARFVQSAPRSYARIALA